VTTVRARRAAVVAGGDERRIVVDVELASLGGRRLAPGSMRRHRAARRRARDRRAPVAVVGGATGPDDQATAAGPVEQPTASRTTVAYAACRSAAGDVVLGSSSRLRRAMAGTGCAAGPPCRDVLALVTRQLIVELS
jgi:hypothetical protein